MGLDVQKVDLLYIMKAGKVVQANHFHLHPAVILQRSASRSSFLGIVSKFQEGTAPAIIAIGNIERGHKFQMRRFHEIRSEGPGSLYFLIF